MKTTALAASAILAILVLGAATVTLAHSGIGLGSGSNSNQSTHSSHTSHDDNQNETEDHNDNQTQSNNQGEDDQGDQGHFNLTVGTTLTFSNLTGHWNSFTNHTEGEDDSSDSGDSNMTNTSDNSGNSTGAFTLKVTGVSDEGFNASITSGTFSINGTTYTVSGGQVTFNEGDESGFGNGTASGGATFTIHVAGIHGNTTTSAQVGAIKLDVQVGKSSFQVILGSNEGVQEDDSSESD